MSEVVSGDLGACVDLAWLVALLFTRERLGLRRQAPEVEGAGGETTVAQIADGAKRQVLVYHSRGAHRRGAK